MGRADHNRKRMLKLQEKKALELKTVKNRFKRQRDKARGKELIALGRKKKPSRIPKLSESAIIGTLVPPPIQADIKKLRAQGAQAEVPPSKKTRNFTANEVAWELVQPKLSEAAQKFDASLGRVAGIKPSVGRVDLAKKFCAKSGKVRQQFFKDVIEPLLEDVATRRFLCMTVLRVVKAQSSLLVESGLEKKLVADLPGKLRTGDAKAASNLFHVLLKLTSRALRGEDVLGKSKVLTAMCNAQLRNFRRSRSVEMLRRRLEKLRPLTVSTLKPLSVALGTVRPEQVMFLAALAKATTRKLIVNQNSIEDGAVVHVVQTVFWQNFGSDESA